MNNKITAQHLGRLYGHPETQKVLVFDINKNKWCAIVAKDRGWFGDNSFLMFPKINKKSKLCDMIWKMGSLRNMKFRHVSKRKK